MDTRLQAITIAIAAALAVIALLSTTLANVSAQAPPQTPPGLKEHAQLTPQEQQLSNCPADVLNSLPPLEPGAFPVCAGSPLLKGAPFNPPHMQLPPGAVPGAAAEKVMKQVQERLAAAPKGTTQAQIFQQMTNEGLINCPAITDPNHVCFLNPKPTGPITPPIAP